MPCLAVDESVPSGTVAVLVLNKERTLVGSYVGAYSKYPTKHLKDNWSIIEQSQVIYTTGFFIQSNYESVKLCAEYVAS